MRRRSHRRRSRPDTRATYVADPLESRSREERRRCAVRALVTIVLAVALASSTIHAATTPALKCQSAKLRAIAAEARKLLECHAHAISTLTPVAPGCLDKAEQSVSHAFASADAAGGCAVAGDGASVATAVDTFVTQVLGSIGAGADGACTIARLRAAGKYAQQLLAAELRHKKGHDLRRLAAARHVAQKFVAERAAAAATLASTLTRVKCAGIAAGPLAPIVESFVAARTGDLFCGDGVRDLPETCDGGNDTLCPGACLADCRCAPRDTDSTCLARGGPVVTVAATDTALDYKTSTIDTTVDARVATFVSSPAALYPVRLTGSDDACIVGPTVAGEHDRTLGWEAMHAMNNAGIYVENQGSTVDAARIDDVTDGIRPIGGPFTIRRAWLSYIRDDCVENDHLHGGLIEDSLLDGCYTAVSERPSPAILASGADGRSETLTINGSLIRLEPMPSPRAGGALDLGHGGFFKWHEFATQLSLHDNVFMAEEAAGNGAGQMDIPPLVTCSNNVMVWLGAGPYPAPLPLCFTITTDRAVWDDAVAAWRQRWADGGG